jgi:preprotein translocase subunit Sec61beta
MEGLTKVMREKKVQSLQSQADWTNTGLLRFFDSSGFGLAPRLVLERSVLTPLAEASDDE